MFSVAGSQVPRLIQLQFRGCSSRLQGIVPIAVRLRNDVGMATIGHPAQDITQHISCTTHTNLWFTMVASRCSTIIAHMVTPSVAFWNKVSDFSIDLK